MTGAQENGFAAEEFLPQLDIHAPERQRRLTVLVRWLLLIPHFIALFFINIAAFVVVFLGWWGALFLGRLPHWAARFLAHYLGYTTRFEGYAYLLTDTYPPFRWAHVEDYPLTIRVEPGQLNRLAVFFRFILVIPAAILNGILGSGWAILAFFFWLSTLIMGRTPRPVFGASAAVLRFTYRFRAYLLLLSSAYPKRLFGDQVQTVADPGWPDMEKNPGSQPEANIEAAPHAGTGTPSRASDTRPLVLSQGGKVLLIVIIVLGVFGYFGGGVAGKNANSDSHNMRDTHSNIMDR